MENEKNYITKKEFYAVAMHLCVLIFLTGLISNQDNDGFGRAYVCLWALGLEIYFVYKMHKAKKEQIDK